MHPFCKADFDALRKCRDAAFGAREPNRLAGFQLAQRRKEAPASHFVAACIAKHDFERFDVLAFARMVGDASAHLHGSIPGVLYAIGAGHEEF